MEKELGHLKFTKTDDGIRIDITGDGLNGLCGCCCNVSGDSNSNDKEQCCEPNDKK